MKQSEQIGIFYTVFAYIVWGLLPIYWKFLGHVSADEILANRIFWAFWFMLLVLLFGKKWNMFFVSLKMLKQQPKTFLALATASVLVSCNWFIYIWAVNAEKMVEASLGYYINPLISVLLGVIVLKEKMSIAQIISFFLALTGVLILTIAYGQFPWVAFGVAITFGIYGLVKKMVKVDSGIGLTLETMFLMPLAFIYILFQFLNGQTALFSTSLSTDLLLMGSGAATAIPLLYFAKGVIRIPLYLAGFIQYIAPTLMLILGVIIYKEPFEATQIIAFSFIWGALILFTFSAVKVSNYNRKQRKKIRTAS
ncbi:EamA family transporter RarD [Lederbergia citrea]|uniref:EamA family transporter RarD n=1 Tax=Lederbergia citrea TaxID=2833581 RepID=A0A942UJR2_9BACI|nr:EamA family transporter RarD [Lederbergia citrea]MBS4222741.1 EamA family transporter RarD [Lederbergia citrea]